MKAVVLLFAWGLAFAIAVLFLPSPFMGIGIVSGIIFVLLTLYIEKHEKRLYKEIKGLKK